MSKNRKQLIYFIAILKNKSNSIETNSIFDGRQIKQIEITFHFQMPLSSDVLFKLKKRE